MKCLGALLFVMFCTCPALAESKGLGDKLVGFYEKKANYHKVKREVLTWHQTTRNGCVAFASTALRRVGYSIPQEGKRDGFGVSRITFAFSDYLEEQGFTRIGKATALQPGDLVFTTGYPDHVFVFHSWRHRKRLRARVIDNKGHLTSRFMFPKRGSDAAFAYALRPATMTRP